MPDAALPDVSMRAGASLQIEALSVAYATRTGWLQALDAVSLSIPPGGVLGLVGESGSGKSTVVLALLGLLGPSARVQARRLAFDGHDLLRDAPALRGRRVGVVFQDTAAALNPALTIGTQVTEPMRTHLRTERRAAWERGTDLLAEMGIPRPAQVMRSYPHQLSGGMKQRVGIATALASEPDLLLLDEPTTALDVTIEAQILSLLDERSAAPSAPSLSQGPAGSPAAAGSSPCRSSRADPRRSARPARARSRLQLPPALRLRRRRLRAAASPAWRRPHRKLPSRPGS